MGTFGYYIGSEIINENKVEEFSKAISKILYYGGMMHLHSVKMYQKEITLLEPVVINIGEDVNFFYNYFEEDSWEDAGYNYRKHQFYSGKIGYYEFNDVIMAVYCLYELYDEGVGLAWVDDMIVSSDFYTGWINHLLDSDFSICKRFNLWALAESLAFDNLEGHDDPLKFENLMKIIPERLRKYSGGTELSDLLYILNGTESLKDEYINKGTYPEDVLRCKKEINSIIEQTDSERAYSMILCLIKKDYKEREAEREECLKPLAECTLFLPARTVLYLACELLEKNFWREWKQLKEEAYIDEKSKKYISDELQNYRNEGRNRPIKKIKTSDFLRNESPFIFHDTPDELMDYPDYYISDADRLYWWNGSDEVEITEDTERWLNRRAEEYKETLKNISDECNTQQFVQELIELLYDIEERYKRVFAFQDMFYEFVANSSKKEYRAAIDVLRKLYDDNADDGKIIEFAKRSWTYTSKNVICNRGRMNMKRYLALLANVELRKKYLGF